MKSLFFEKVFFLCVLGIGLSAQAHAYLLEEQILQTPKKGCKIYYLTEKNTNGWHIETDREECGSDKLLTGYHNITVYNAFSKPVEKLYGFFSNGYWTDDALLNGVVFNRFSDELGVQKATFPIYEDTEIDVKYIGQMTSKKTYAGTYPAFKVCSPFRVLAVISNVEDLSNTHFLHRVFQTVERESRRFCPTGKDIQLYLSGNANPEKDDIYMYIQMDLKTHRHKIIRSPKLRTQGQPQEQFQPQPQAMPQPQLQLQQQPPFAAQAQPQSGESSEMEMFRRLLIPLLGMAQPQKETKEVIFKFVNAPEPPQTQTITYQIPQSIEKEDKNLNQTTSFQTAQQKKATQKAPVEITKKSSLSPQTTPLPVEEIQEEIIFEDDETMEFEDIQTIQTDKDLQKSNENENTQIFNEIQETPDDAQEEFVIPAPQKSYLKPFTAPKEKKAKKMLIKNGKADISSTLLPLSHAKLIAQVLQMPVLTLSVLHITKADAATQTLQNGTIWLSGNKLSTGWYKAIGVLKEVSGKKNVFSFEINNSQLCEQDYCLEDE